MSEEKSIFKGMAKKKVSLNSAFESKKQMVNEEKNKIFSSLLKEKKVEKSPYNIKDLVSGDSFKPSLSGIFLSKNNVAIPHYFSQTAIYAPRKQSRDGIERNMNKPIWAQGKLSVSYQGPELDTKIDYKLMSIVLKARDLQEKEDHIVKLNYKETMEALGLNPHHPDSRKKFHSSIERHLAAKFHFAVDNEKEGFWRPFFEAEHTVFSYKRNQLFIQLSDMIPKLFKQTENGSFSIEDMIISFAIKNSYASKLYSYYESNNNPYPIKVSTVLELCDHALEEGKKPTNNHRATLKKALNELLDLGFLEKWHFDESKDKRDPLLVVKKTKEKELNKINHKKNLEFKDDFIAK